MQDDLLHDVVAVEARGRQGVYLRFDDGVEGEIDLGPVIGPFEGVFAPLADPAYFARVTVNSEIGTICWPNGADIDPVLLYCAVRGVPPPGSGEPKKARRLPKAPSRPRRASRRP